MNLFSPHKSRQLLILFLIYFSSYSIYANPFEIIPFRNVGEHLFIHLTTPDQDTLNFVFDTGASTLVLNSDLVERKEWNFNQRTTSTGVSGSAVYQMGYVPGLASGKIKMENILGVSAPLSHLELRIGERIDGIIGYEILNRFIVSIDYANEKLDIFDSKKKPETSWGNPFPIGLQLRIPSIQADISLSNTEKISGRFFIDSGAGSALILNSPLVRKHEIETKLPFGYLDQSRGLSNTDAPTVESMIPKLTFCDFEVESIPTRLSRSRNGVMAMEDYAGIIGNQILKRFILTFNYKKGIVYVAKNKALVAPFTHNTSGLKIRLSQNRQELVVDQVIEDSPAEKAGIHALDILLKVNGESSSTNDLHEIRKLLSAIDQEIELKFLRGDDSYSTKLELKSWFK